MSDKNLKYIKAFTKLETKRLQEAQPVLDHLGIINQDEASPHDSFKYFLDFGTHLGEGMQKILDHEKFQQGVEVHSFEANPYVFKQIERNEGINYYNIAVSELTGFFTLNYEIEEKGGATLFPLDTWNPETLYSWKKNERFEKYKQVMVPCMSILTILDSLLPEDKKEKSIIAKFDIEGAEYGILEALKETDNFKWFDKIYIEFHQHLFQNQLPKTTDIAWLKYFEEIGLTTVLWE